MADLFLSVPQLHRKTLTTCGLYIEIKTPKGRQSPEQIVFQDKVQFLCYQYTICRSLAEFQTTIQNYLKP